MATVEADFEAVRCQAPINERFQALSTMTSCGGAEPSTSADEMRLQASDGRGSFFPPCAWDERQGPEWLGV
eukprot:3025123-Amphidinium_carterae.2